MKIWHLFLLVQACLPLGCTFEPLFPPVTGYSVPGYRVGPILGNGTLVPGPNASLYFMDRSYAGTTGVYRSLDDGATWSQIRSFDGATPPTSLIVTPGGIIIVGTYGAGLFRSSDGGKTWKEVGDFAGTSVEALAFTPDNHLFAAARRGIYRSTDGGTSWVLPDSSFDVIATGLGSNSRGHLYLISPQGYIGNGQYLTTRGLFRSLDDGQQWVKVDLGLPDTTVEAIAIDANDRIFVVTTGDLVRSLDGGQSWEYVLTGGVSGPVWNSHGDLFAARKIPDLGNGRDVVVSIDGGNTWIPTTFRSVDNTVNDLCMSSKGYLFVITANSLLYWSTDNGTTWRMRYP